MSNPLGITYVIAIHPVIYVLSLFFDYKECAVEWILLTQKVKRPNTEAYYDLNITKRCPIHWVLHNHYSSFMYSVCFDSKECAK